MNFVTRDRTAEVLRAMRDLTDRIVLVGIPSSRAGRKDVPMNNAAIGYVQEHGSPAQNIPARPFLVPGVQDARAAALARLEAAARRAMAGDAAGMDQQMHAAGLIAQNAVRAKISSNIPPPLSSRTLAARAARGVTRTNTLIDTGQLRAAITYVLRRRRG